MKIKLLLPILLFLGAFYLNAQKNLQDQYSKKELQSFSEIYKHQLDNPFDVAAVMKNAAKQLTISEKRMGEIMRAQFAGRKIDLNKEEKAELLKLKALMAVEKGKHEKRMAAFMASKKLKPSKFNEIRHSFHEDKTFQVSVIKQTKNN